MVCLGNVALLLSPFCVRNFQRPGSMIRNKALTGSKARLLGPQKDSKSVVISLFAG